MFVVWLNSHVGLFFRVLASWKLSSLSDLRVELETAETEWVQQCTRQNLVGGCATPPKNMKVSWDHSSQAMET
jgi:hypothetical protein